MMNARTIGLATGLATLLATAEATAACDQDQACSGGPARIMLIVDASSATLNVSGQPGNQGVTAWDVIREVVAGAGDTLYDAPVEPPGPVASQVIHFGLAVFGNDQPAPGEAEILVSYAPCSEPRVEWALDPLSSCVAPGCTDPWGGPPITWTSQDGSQIDPPGFAARTLSHMPRCDGQPGEACAGSARFVAPALFEVSSHRPQYEATTPYVRDQTTQYVNVLVITGPHDDTGDDVRIALEEAFDAGITTYVLAYGSQTGSPSPMFRMQLEAMADAGSGSTLEYLAAANAGELSNALRGIVAALDLPCCASIDCAYVGGADSGANGSDDDAGADWGGADGTAGEGSGGASASDGASTGATAPAGEIDDDGGCTCRSTATPGSAWSWLVALGLWGLGRRRPAVTCPRRAEPRTREPGC
jgi:hypothetical protein